MATISKTPTKSEVINLMAGDLVTNCFGKLVEVTRIIYRGQDINGRCYVGFYTKFGIDAEMSQTIKEDENIFTIN